MLIVEKKITKVIVGLDDNEIASFNDVYSIADDLITTLDENKATDFMNPATGEIIDRDDLSRILGVISGLKHCGEWVLM
jgi:hypothetical protein